MNRSARILLAVLVIVAGLFLWAKWRYAGKAPVRLAASDCDASLWQHVYKRDRLQVIAACTAMEGRVVSVHESGEATCTSRWIQQTSRS